MERAAVYTRISKDVAGESAATARQEAACRSFADARGWEVVQVFEDVDVSAFREVERPGYEQMLDAARAGAIDVLLVWKMDRLVRRPKEFERAWDILEANDVRLASVNDAIDTSHATGRAMLRVLIAFGSLEAETMSLRIRSQKEAVARAGQPKHGGPRPFGLTRDWSETVPEEAEMIRDAARRIISGESLRSIYRGWNDEGRVTSTDGSWTSSGLRSLLLQRRLCGERVYKGEVVAENHCPAILDRETCDRVAAVLRDPKRRAAKPASRNLLSGLIKCGVCGGRMASQSPKRQRRRYACVGGEGCGKTAIVADPTEEVVVNAVMIALDGPALHSALDGNSNEDDGLLARLDLVRERQAEADDMFASGEIDRASFGRIASRLRIQTRNIEREIAASQLTAVSNAWSGRGSDLRETWDSLSIDQRRAILSAVVERLAIPPANGKRFNEERVLSGIEWKV